MSEVAVVSTINDRKDGTPVRKLQVGSSIGGVAGAASTILMWAASNWLFPPAIYMADVEVQTAVAVLLSGAVGAVVTGATTFVTAYYTAPGSDEGTKQVLVPG